MLKKTISAILAFALVLTLGFGVRAAGLEGEQNEITRVLSARDAVLPENALQAVDRPELQSRDTENYILPYYWTYGQSVVVGETMTLHTMVDDVGLTGGYQLIAVFEGTYDAIGEGDKPVSSGVFPCKGTSAGVNFEWKTTNLTPGDYTVVFLLQDQNEELVFGTYADLYLSDREIPLEGIDLYVYEVDGNPDKIAMGTGARFSVGVQYRPYHTTVDRSVTLTSENNSFVSDFYGGFTPGTWGVQAPGANADTVLTAACAGYTDRVTVYVRDFENSVIPVTEHKLDPDRIVLKQAPTATKDGTGVGNCLYCGQEVEAAVPRIFTDTRSDAFYSDAVDYCYANGIIQGVSENRFAPNQSLTRGMLITMLYRYAGSPEVSGRSPFTDVKEGRYFYEAIVWAGQNQLVNGFPDGTCKPDAAITREQMVTVLFRYVQYLDQDNGLRADLSAFSDVGHVSNYAVEPMQWAVANGVIQGVTDTKISPRGTATRAQTAAVLYRTLLSL